MARKRITQREERENLSRVPDGGVLRALANGIVLPRRRKHEPIDPKQFLPREFRWRTDTVRGSKFSRDWTLREYVRRVEAIVAERGWRFPPGGEQRVSVVYEHPIGWVDAHLVYTLRVEISGRYVHAWPMEDV